MKELRKEISNKRLMLLCKQEIDVLHYGINETSISNQKSDNVFNALNYSLQFEKVKPLKYNEYLDIMYLVEKTFGGN